MRFIEIVVTYIVTVNLKQYVTKFVSQAMEAYMYMQIHDGAILLLLAVWRE